MPPAPVILRHPTRQSGRVASVHAEPAGEGTHLLHVARGEHPDRLSADRTLGPFGDDELQSAFDAAVDELRAEGYQSGGLSAAVELLTRTPRDPRRRAMAAGRLFWRADPAVCEPLLAALAEADEEACPVLDALGRCGDERAFAAVRENAGRKLLSRRRSGIEALIHLRDEQGVAAARERVRSELPDAMAEAAASDDATVISAALNNVDEQRRGQAADYLYEYAGLVNDPAAADAAIRWAESLAILGEPFAWRYVKSLFKRSCLRLDADAFGRLSRLIDTAKTRSRTASVKSGLTGQTEITTIFTARTRDYLRRRSWRHLRRLAEHEPARYAEHAASVIAAYRPADSAALARGSDKHRRNRLVGVGPWSRSYLVGHVLHGGDPGVRFHGMRWSDAAERERREELLKHSRRWPVLPESRGVEFVKRPVSVWQRLRWFLTRRAVGRVGDDRTIRANAGRR